MSHLKVTANSTIISRLFISPFTALLTLFGLCLLLPRTLSREDVPFYVLDPEDYRHYFPDNVSFHLASRVAPFLDLPTCRRHKYRDILTAYYYRIRSYRKHIVKTEKYWVVTEFLPNVPWAGVDNTISAAAGHHILEGRWFWDAPEFVQDYIRFWYTGAAKNQGPQPHISQYTNWIYHATWQYSLLWGLNRTQSLLEDTLENAANVFRNIYNDKYLTNSSHNSPLWNTTGRVCWMQEDVYDAMEVSVSGGGCRPTIAAAMWGEAMALVHVATEMGDQDAVQEFTQWASFSRNVILEQHWNAAVQSFAVIPPPRGVSRYSIEQSIRHVHQYTVSGCDLDEIRTPNQLVNVRELLAFMPWYYSTLIPPGDSSAATFARQFAWLLESTGEEGFSAPWGLRTVQRSSPCYNYSWEHGDCWNGPSWPYETSRVLTAVSNLLTEHEPSTIQASGMNAHVFEQLLRQYARQHTATMAVNDTAHPLHSGHVFENLHPDEGYWNNRARMYWRNDARKDMGDDYNHSTFLDLILSAWLGIRMPSTDSSKPWLVLYPLINAPYFAADRIPYRGRVLSIVFDPTGTQYPKVAVKGLVVLVDGQVVAKRTDVGRLVIQAEPPMNEAWLKNATDKASQA